jgi:pyrimidine-nucleoside phosphorylase
MLIVASVAADGPEADAKARGALRSGAALEKLRQIVENQGGDPRVIDDYARLPAAPDRAVVEAPSSGFLVALHAECLGRAAVALGAGRARLDDEIDHGVGIEIHAQPGAALRAGDPVVTLHHRGGRGLDEALALARQAVGVAAAPEAPAALIVEELS